MRTRRAHRGAVVVQSVTGARSGLSEDVRARTRRYLFSMGVRTVCLVGAVLVHGPLRWVLVAAAVALPYVAVVAANAGRERGSGAPPAAVLPQDVRSLTPGRRDDAAADRPADGSG